VCLIECDREASTTSPWPTGGCCTWKNLGWLDCVRMWPAVWSQRNDGTRGIVCVCVCVCSKTSHQTFNV